MDGNIRRQKLDTDLTDEKAWQMRPELAKQSKARKATEAKQMASKVAADKKGVVAASVTKLDTDHSDEVAWQQRKKLRSASKARKAKEAADLAAKNRAIFANIRRTQRSDKIDDNIMDEEEWDARPDLAVQSAAQRLKESLDLNMKNKELRERLKRIKPQVVITSREGVETYREPSEWLDPIKFAQMPRTRDKGSVEDMIRRAFEPPPPSWLTKWEPYDYHESATTR